MIACVFPGQGSQKVGMGQALAAAFPEAAAVFAEADAALPGLGQVMAEGPAESLTLTENTQPAILTVSVAAYRVLSARGLTPAYMAGHSLGEYSANVAAGALAFGDAVRLVRNRGRYMQEAVPVGTGAMAAVLGLDEAGVAAACAEAAQGEIVAPANINGGGQVVIAGTVAAVARAGEAAKARGARRVLPLPVSAPFHCALMQPAADRLEPELRALAARAPQVPIVANVDAEARTDAAGVIDALVRQVVAPVRWEAVVRRLGDLGVTTFIEVGPGAVLAGLVRKILPEATVASVGEPKDLDAVAAWLVA